MLLDCAGIDNQISPERRVDSSGEYASEREKAGEPSLLRLHYYISNLATILPKSVYFCTRKKMATKSRSIIGIL